ncbi:hypothetical protein BDC45DRAFT_166895 [Circinella umbellata]|nr:hypothetical protein BDC45DRAFT_166895 [Circinella umbellata]
MVMRTTPDLRSFKQYFNHKNGDDSNVDSVMGQEEAQHQQLPSIPAQLSSSSLHLTELTVANEMNIDTLIRLLKRAPHLQKLSLNSIIYPNCMKVLQTICNVCPDIQQFHHVDMKKYPSCVTKYTLPSNESDSTSFSMGLKELTLEYFPMETEILDDNSVYNIFQKYHDTLETIEINAMELPLRFNCLDKLSVLGAPRLKKLALDFYNNQNISTNTIMMIINGAKNLEDLTIIGMNFWEQKIFNALAELKDLRKLTIGRTHTQLDLATHEYIDEDPDEDPEEEYHGVMLKGSWFAPLFSSKKLTQFTYLQTNLSGEAFLLDLAPYIAKSSIQELNLGTWIEDDETLEIFLNKLGNDNHTLRRVSLWLDFEYEAEDIAKFSRIENLSYLNLVDITSDQEPFGKEMLSNLLQEIQKRDKFAYVSLENQKRTCRIKGYTHGSLSLSSTSSSANKLDTRQNFVLQEIDLPSEDDSNDDEPVYFTMRCNQLKIYKKCL